MSDFSIMSLQEICISPITYGVVKPGEAVYEGVKFIRGGDIFNGQIQIKNLRTISKEKSREYKRTLLRGGEILVSLVGNPGEVAIVPNVLKDANIARQVGLLRISKEQCTKYIKYLLMSPIGKNELSSCIGGSVQQVINLKDLKKIKFSLPPLPEQKAIASVLSSLDDKIDLLHRQNKTLEAMAETLFRQWFVEEAEDSWEVKSLYESITLVGGGTPKTKNEDYWNGTICWLSGGDISSNHKSVATESEKSITYLGLENSSAKLLPQYSTVVSARGTVGKYCILSKPMAFSQSNYGILPKFENCYFFTYLLINYSIEALQAAAYGSVFDTITTNTFKGLDVKLPANEVIKTFENKVEPYFKKIVRNKVQIEQLQKQRYLLLPKLMSGEVKVI